MPEIILENLFWIPIAKEEVWDALQSKNYQGAQDSLEEVLRLIPPPEWKYTFWTGIWDGFMFLRGDLSESEWKNNVRPILAKAILNVATGEALSNIYKNLLSSSGAVSEFQQVLVAATPGVGEEKMAWLKMYKPAIYTFLVGTPAQDLGICFFESIRKVAPAIAFERYQSLPYELREEILRYATAEDFFRICTAQHLPEEKISRSAQVIGRVLMGFIHADDAAKEIQAATKVDLRIAEIIAGETGAKLFAKLANLIRAAYDPINLNPTPPIPEPPRSKTISLETIGEAPFAHRTPTPVRTPAPAVTPTKGEGPLILHEEKGAAAEAQKGFKGFSIPLSFFRSKIAPNAAPKAAARVEMPPTTAPPQKKPARPARFDEASARQAGGDEPRVVHYNENRTPLSPFGQNEEFINLETFEKFSPPAVSIKPKVEETPLPSPIPAPPIQPAPPAEPAPATPEKISEVSPPKITAPEGGEPRLSGNTVDLR